MKLPGLFSPTAPIGLVIKEKTAIIWDLTEDQIRSSFPLPVTSKRAEETKVFEPFDRLPPDVQTMRLWLTNRLIEKWNASTTGPETMLSWRKEFLRAFNESTKGEQSPLRKLPVFAVSSNPMANDSVPYSRQVAGVKLDFLSTNSIHLTAAGSGHEIHLYKQWTR